MSWLSSALGAVQDVAEAVESGGGAEAVLGQGLAQFGFSEPTPVETVTADPDAPNPNRDIRNEVRASGQQGNRKSLLVGINYRGQQGELRGCINDVLSIKNFLEAQGFPDDPDSMRVLTEDEDESNYPNAGTIMEGMRWLVEGAQAGDDLFFHYSGHGSQMRDDDGDEADRKDECLVPLDFRSGGGMLRDDDIYDTLVKALPVGAKLTVILDCCHSGTAMDLPYVLKANGTNMEEFESTGSPPSMNQNPAWDMKALGAALKSVMAGDYAGALGGLLSAFKQNRAPPQEEIPQEAQDKVAETKANLAEVIMFSGCKDDQTSADVGNIATFGLPPDAGPGGAGGACTNAFLATMNETGGELTWAALLSGMRQRLEARNFSQVPQLSTTHVMHLADNFNLFE